MEKTSRSGTAAIIVTMAVLLIGACTLVRGNIADEDIYKAVQIGMSRKDVEASVGKPVLDLGREAYYGSKPAIEDWQSPVAPYSVRITYSKDNVVESKKHFTSQRSHSLPK